jgi:hypothetical protein
MHRPIISILFASRASTAMRQVAMIVWGIFSAIANV